MIRAGQKFPLPHQGQLRFVVATGEFRPPKAGEWFLSGVVVEGYRAENDHTASYHIAKPEPPPAEPARETAPAGSGRRAAKERTEAS